MSRDDQPFRALERPLRSKLPPGERGGHLLHGVAVHHMHRHLNLDPSKYVDHAGAYRVASPLSNGIDTRIENAFLKADRMDLSKLPPMRAQASGRHPDAYVGEKLRAMKYHSVKTTHGDDLLAKNPAFSGFHQRCYARAHNSGLARETTFHSPAQRPFRSMDRSDKSPLPPAPRSGSPCLRTHRAARRRAGACLSPPPFRDASPPPRSWSPPNRTTRSVPARSRPESPALDRLAHRMNGMHIHASGPRGKTFYRGGSFLPGGGRAPKGGCYS